MKKTILLLVILPLLSFSAHKYYISLTQIKFSPKEKSVQIIINVFIDDIELALNKDYNIDLQLTTKNELKENDFYFKKYLREKLQLKINTISKEFNYIGKEFDGDLVYFYLEIEDIEKVENIDITNKILIKHFPDQQNLIKSKVLDKNKSELLTKKEPQALLKF